MKLKNLVSIMLAAVVAITTLCVTTSAFDSNADYAKNAIVLKSGTTNTKTYGYIYNSNSGETKVESCYYRLDVAKEGNVSFNFKINEEFDGWIYLRLYNKYGTEMTITNGTADAGRYSKIDWNGSYGPHFSSYNWSIDGNAEYYLDKGTYYLYIDFKGVSKERVYTSNFKNIKGNSATCDLKIKATFPSATASSGEITGIGIKLSKGSKVSLYGIISGSSSSVKWSSSDSSIASVSSSGTVTAKKKGTVTITAKVGDTSQKIKVKVV